MKPIMMSQKSTWPTIAEGGVEIEEVAARTPDRILTETAEPGMGLLPFQALGMLTLSNPEALEPGGCVHLEGLGSIEGVAQALAGEVDREHQDHDHHAPIEGQGYLHHHVLSGLNDDPWHICTRDSRLW